MLFGFWEMGNHFESSGRLNYKLSAKASGKTKKLNQSIDVISGKRKNPAIRRVSVS
jgi:hypothetical protein